MGAFVLGAQHRTHMHRKKESKCIEVANLNHQHAGRQVESSRIKQSRTRRYVADTTTACMCLFTQNVSMLIFHVSEKKGLLVNFLEIINLLILTS